MLRKTTVENGKIHGIAGADPRITAYKGVPFAKPPVGELRWRAPQRLDEKWDGEYYAVDFAPISVQDQPGVGTDVYCKEWHVDPDIPMDEDCLYLNIWTPAKSADEKLPVLVWFFGGGYQWGYTAEMEFDGERIARRGVIVVSVNYRLAALGFMVHPEITADAKAHGEAPGNFGLLDQQAGLNWVRRNIAAFGGDPDRITIAGQSAGGGSVMQQLTCKDNFDIIKGAVIFSGMIKHPDPKMDIFKPIKLEEAEKRGQDFFNFLGVKNLTEARALDAFEIRAKYGQYAAEHPRVFPIEDGVFCVGDPYTRFINGDRAKVPVFAGNTVDEFVIDGRSIVEPSVKNAFLSSGADNMYYYCFEPDIPGDDHPGCFHSCDLWFFFETLGKCWRHYVGRHYDLARQMCNYYANFVKNGTPNGNDPDGSVMPEWKPYTASEHFEMHFTSDGAKGCIGD